jgi:hypothetical protein
LKRLLGAVCNQGAAGSIPAAGTIFSIYISDLWVDIENSRCLAYSPPNQDLELTVLIRCDFAHSRNAMLVFLGHFGSDHLIMRQRYKFR